MLILVAVLAVIPILVGIRRRREGIRYWLKKIFAVEAVYLGVTFIMVRVGQPPVESLLVGVIAALVINSFIKPRKRNIPAATKLKARAKFELKTGTKFNPKKHEYDHKVPFSKLGSHTPDNVRVVDKKTNRSKGARSPWWDVLGK